MAHNVSAKPDARRQARVPKAKARSAAAGFACYAMPLFFHRVTRIPDCEQVSELACAWESWCSDRLS
jgi:hypothetical protein